MAPRDDFVDLYPARFQARSGSRKCQLDIYHSNLASRNNEATRILTVMGTVSLPAVVIATFFGMTLKYPGWMSGPGAILIVSGIIVAVTTGLLWYLKKRNYL